MNEVKWPDGNDMPKEPMRGQSEQRVRQDTNTTASNVQRELDQRLLEMCNGQLRALGTVINRLTMVVIVSAIVCSGLLLWTHQTANMRHEAMLERIAMLEANQQATAEKVIKAVNSAEAYAERASKHVWELKTALKLKFSQQRSAETPDGEK